MRAHAFMRGHAARVRGCLFGYLALPQGYCELASKAGSTSSERINKLASMDVMASRIRANTKFISTNAIHRRT